MDGGVVMKLTGPVLIASALAPLALACGAILGLDEQTVVVDGGADVTSDSPGTDGNGDAPDVGATDTAPESAAGDASDGSMDAPTDVGASDGSDAASGCGGGCRTPPPCHTSAGSCDGGSCWYPLALPGTACTGGSCDSAGDCIPCGGPCDAPPTDCYNTAGTCNGGACAYTPRIKGSICPGGTCDGAGNCEPLDASSE